MDKNAAGLYCHHVTCCCRHLEAKCKVLVKYNNTDGAVFLTSLRKLNSLVRSCNSLYVIKRPRLVLLYSKTQFCARRQEGCSLLNEYSAKAPSSNQNCNLWSSFYKELLSQGGGGRGQEGSLPGAWFITCAPEMFVLLICFPECMERLSVCKVCHMLEEAEAFVFALCPSEN